MTNEEVKDANKEVRRIRSKFKYNGEAYDDFTPLELAARIVAFCDSKGKLRETIAYLKDLDTDDDEDDDSENEYDDYDPSDPRRKW